MNVHLRLRPVDQLPLRLFRLDDGNGNLSNKRASIPLPPGLDSYFYLRFHLPDMPSAVRFAKTSTRKVFAALLPLEARICKICFSIALFSRKRRNISFSSLGHIR